MGRLPVVLVLLLSVGALAVHGTANGQNAKEPLRAAFQDPPAAFRPLIISHGGTLKNPEALQWLTERRVGGTVLDVGVSPKNGDDEEPWNDPSYLNDPQVFDRLREVIDQLRQRDWTVWIYDELGYPSASAGGRVLQGHPEYQVWAVSCREFLATAGKVQVDVRHPHVEACLALPERNGVLALDEAIDLTGRATAGPFTWQAPKGRWRVCLFERYQPDTWQRHNIPRRNVNIMDRRAIQRFIQITHERYAEELGSQLDDVTLFFTDEPQFGATEPWMYGHAKAAPAVQWCDQLPGAFAHRKGYAITKALPALFHNVGPETARFRYDFYDVQSDLVAENYYGQIQDWCHEHGVWSSGHMLLEESLLFHVMWSGSMVKNWSRMDLPGVDLLGLPRYKTMAGWNGDIVPVQEDFSCKMAASIAHLNGKPGVFTESFAVARDTTLPAVRGIAAWQFATGVTHMSSYTIQNQLSAEDYASFADFAGRLALLCRRGQSVSDVAVLVPEASVWAAYQPPDGGMFPRYLQQNRESVRIDHSFRETCHQLLAHQRDFEIFSERLLQQATLNDGRLELAGQSFAFVVLPEVRMLHEKTIDQLKRFVEVGGHVAFVGSLPSQDPKVGESAAVSQRAGALLSAAGTKGCHVNDLEQLDDLIDWMQACVRPPVVWSGPSQVRIMRRQEAARDMILVANPSPQDVSGRLSCDQAGDVTVWNPETGTIQTVGWRDSRGEVALDVPADSARFVVVRHQP